MTKTMLGGVSLLALTLGSAAAWAQTADKSAGLEEIVVTAERREASLQTVPIAVSAFSEQALEHRQIRETRDLQYQVPSLKLANNVTSPTNLSPSLRGSTQQDASLIVAESPFGLYVDDVYLGRMNGNNVTFADVERVEVLKGPQGTLYGRNTAAGAIKFISRTPGDTAWVDLKTGYGTWHQYLASGSVGGPITDTLAGSFAAQTSGKGGEFYNIATNHRIGEEDNWALRGKLRFHGNSGFEATFTASYAKSDNDATQQPTLVIPGVSVGGRQFHSSEIKPLWGGYYNVNRPLNTAAVPPLEQQTRGQLKQFIGSLNASYDLGNATIRSITAYVNTKDYFNTDFTGVGAIYGASDAKADQFTEELQIQGTALDKRLNYIAGAFYLHEKADQTFGWEIGVPFSRVPEHITTSSVAVFTQADYKITEALKATAGIRWLQDKKDFGITFQSLVPFLPPQAPINLNNKYSAVTPKFGLDYTIPPSGALDSLMLYLSAARGFKSGGYNGINIADLSVARTPYFPEKNWTYEAGVKSEFLERRVRLNADYFINKITDLTLNNSVRDANGNIAFPVQNAGSAQIQGLETELSLAPVQGLTVYANGAFLKGKYTSYRPGSGADQAAQTYGKAVPPQIPSAAFTIGFDYGVDFGLGGHEAHFSFGGDWFHTSSYFVGVNNQMIVDPFSRLGAFVALGLDNRWELRLNGKNLQNNKVINSGDISLGPYLILPPREVMLTLSYKM